MPGTHRTPPDADGCTLFVASVPPGTVVAADHRSGVAVAVEVPPDALPALVVALAAHLTVDARRALTRNLAAQDGDAVVDVAVAIHGEWVLRSVHHKGTHVFTKDADVFRAAVEAARPTPTQDGDRG